MDFNLFKEPHPHPLIYIDEGKNDGESFNCSKCHKSLNANPPAFSCLTCDFHIHQSCIDLPPVIQTHFHPHPSLNLTTNNNVCNCCWLMPSGQIYLCSQPQCGFQIDIKCALADTNQSGLQRKSDIEFRHFSHPHPLILQQDTETDPRKDHVPVVCLVCELPITSGSTYFCSYCDFHFHKECAELPREIQNLDYHPHPLLLFPRPFIKASYCNSCKNNCTQFFYCCPKCNFNLHISCLSSNFPHKHTFTKFRNEMQFVCQACGDKGNEPWFCINSHLMVHEKCAKLPSTLRTSGHRLHALSLVYFRNPVDVPDKIFCKICNEEIIKTFAGYVCYQCNYFAHLNCAGRHRIDPRSRLIGALDSPTDPINGDDLENDQIPHFSHEHKLSMSHDGELELDKRCDGCMKHLSFPSYSCTECDFFLHKDCVKLPSKKWHFLHEHPLALISVPDFTFNCNACLEYFHGFAYHCEECRFTLDIRCASIKIPFHHSSHEHPLSLYHSTNDERNCDGCGQKLENKTVFRCVNCHFYLDAGCATLPIAVRYRFDTHPLNLTFLDEEDNEASEFYCDVCEEERDTKVWFYSCRMCCFAAHIGCVLGEFPYLKFGMCEDHSHLLKLVMKNKNKKKESSSLSDNCGVCNGFCGENLAYECSRWRCKFSVHAIGPCFHRQLVQGKFKLTMNKDITRSFPPPGVGLHENSIPNHKSGQRCISLGLYGGGGGDAWEERVFSRIKQLVVNHKEFIYGIQIEYDKNGNSISSDKHGGDGGSKSKVVLDYPKEYLVSIHGYYGNLREYGLDMTVVRSLTFVTNTRSHGPFGVEKDIKFSFPANGDQMKIVAIFGRAGSFLDSIGLHAVPNYIQK